MAFLLRSLSGERSVSKLAGLYRARDDAESAATRLAGLAGLETTQLRVLGPEDARRPRNDRFVRAVEPEVSGIFRTILRSHAICGAVGAAIGVVLFLALYFRGEEMIVSSPWLALIAITGFAAIFGLFVAGLLSLRPDHSVLINELRAALKASRWAVVVHPTSEQQFDAAREVLELSGAKVLTTF